MLQNPGIQATTLKTEQENDTLKEKLAKENGIKNYIIIDCKFSELEYIRQNILTSIMINYFDLSRINWLKCHEFACKSLVKDVSNLWNSGITNLLFIGEKLNLHRTTILRYLKQANKLGWCNYDPDKQKRKNGIRGGKNRAKKVIQITNQGNFIKEWSSTREAAKILGITNKIPEVCKGKRKTAGGFRWMYKEDYEQYIKQVN